jgi:hypothetical protein
MMSLFLLRRSTEMSMQRLKKLSTMIKLGNIEGLDYLVTKWQWQYDDIKFENLITPLILAVMSNQLPMVQFLVSQGVDMDHLDLVGRSAIDWSISCNYETIYYFLKSSVKKTTSSTASSTSSQSVQSVQILESEPNIHSRSLKSANKQPRVVAFYEDSPDMRSTQRAARNYEDELAPDEPNFKKDVMQSFSGRHIESLKVSDHLSPLTQSTAVPFTSSKKSSSILSPLTSRSSRSKQSRSWVATDSIVSERTVEPSKSETLRIEVDNANTKDLSPDSVRKWMTKRIVAAAEAVIPNIESANPAVTKPRFTRSIRKASSKAVKYFWKKKFDTKKIEE